MPRPADVGTTRSPAHTAHCLLTSHRLVLLDAGLDGLRDDPVGGERIGWRSPPRPILQQPVHF